MGKQYRNINNYIEEWIAHNFGFYALSIWFGVMNLFGVSAFNDWFIEKIKQAKDVDMEDKEDWWDLWKHLF